VQPAEGNNQVNACGMRPLHDQGGSLALLRKPKNGGTELGIFRGQPDGCFVLKPEGREPSVDGTAARAKRGRIGRPVTTTPRPVTLVGGSFETFSNAANWAGESLTRQGRLCRDTSPAAADDDSRPVRLPDEPPGPPKPLQANGPSPTRPAAARTR